MAGRSRRDLRRPAARFPRFYVGLVGFGGCCRGGPGLAPGGWGGCVFGCVGEASRGGTLVLPAIGFFPVLITHLPVVWGRLDVLPSHDAEGYRARLARSQGASRCCLFCNTKARRHRAVGPSTSLEGGGRPAARPHYFPLTRSTSLAIARTDSKWSGSTSWSGIVIPNCSSQNVTVFKIAIES